MALGRLAALKRLCDQSLLKFYRLYSPDQRQVRQILRWISSFEDDMDGLWRRLRCGGQGHDALSGRRRSRSANEVGEHHVGCLDTVFGRKLPELCKRGRLGASGWLKKSKRAGRRRPHFQILPSPATRAPRKQGLRHRDALCVCGWNDGQLAWGPDWRNRGVRHQVELRDRLEIRRPQYACFAFHVVQARLEARSSG